MFLEEAQTEKLRDGTTAVVGLVVGKKLYVANTGDSRAVIFFFYYTLSLISLLSTIQKKKKTMYK